MSLVFDEIGYWSELKLEIVKKYASTACSVQPIRWPRRMAHDVRGSRTWYRRERARRREEKAPDHPTGV
jgi:hypothetical protein